jgi:TatA/E family protein of Tat protein translocase
MFGLRAPELLLILLIIVLLFGAKKLPQLADSLGKGIRAFKKASDHGFEKDEEPSAEARSQAQLSQGSPAAKPPASEAEKARSAGNGRS